MVKWEQRHNILSSRGILIYAHQCHADKVVAVEMGDTPGCLDKILDNLRQANISIDYLYISYNRQAGTPVAVFKTREMETETFLRGKGYTLLDTF